MSKLLIQDLSYGYATTLFEAVDLRIDDNEKIGIVGNNGAGKSTLLRCITGDLEPTQGSVSVQRGLKIATVGQHTPPELMSVGFRESVARVIPEAERSTRDWQVDYSLDVLGVPDTVRDRPLEVLSGGWQRFALLTRAWLDEPDLLILDEPTNFLDLEKIILLEHWIKGAGKDTPMLIVSHDRRFLDDVTEATLFLRVTASRSYPAPYSRAVELLAMDDAALENRRDRELQKIERLRRSAHALKQIGANKHSDTALKRSMQLNRRVSTLEKAVTTVHKEARRDIRLSYRPTHADILINFLDVSISAPDGRFLLRIPKLEVRQGDRIAVLGRNGVGKSQLMSRIKAALMDRVAGKAAGIAITPSANPGYVDQMLSELPREATPEDYLNRRFGMPSERVTTLLVTAGFDMNSHDRKIATLSAGQRARLLLLVLRIAEPNLYLLDEPTNHVDIAGQEQLAEEILEHDATCVVISHDREFVESIANRCLLIENQHCIEVESPGEFYREIAA